MSENSPHDERYECLQAAREVFAQIRSAADPRSAAYDALADADSAALLVFCFATASGEFARELYLLEQCEGVRAIDLQRFLAAVKQQLREEQSQQRDAWSKDLSEEKCPYKLTPNGFVHKARVGKMFFHIALTNFTAEICADVQRDDGVEITRTFEMQASLQGQVSKFSVPAASFNSLAWVLNYVGAEAVIMPGMGSRDHVRAAVQLLSSNIAHRTVYSHLGWRYIEGQWVYLHSGGAIGTFGTLAQVEVEPPEILRHYCLPEPPHGDELVQAVQATLRVMKVAPPEVIVPLLAAIFRAPLAACDFSVALVGPTGVGKTELAALAQQHFGATMDARHLPGNWASTANALEALAFAAKDALLVVDDFAPGGSQQDVQRYHREADRLLRAQGNAAGRQRMNADGSLRPTKQPRGMILLTAEDVPRGQSLQARMFVLEVGPQDVNWDCITTSQEDGSRGLFAKAMAAYIQWLAPRMEQIRSELSNQVVKLRTEASRASSHRRTPQLVASLAIGLKYFLAFAADSGAIEEGEATRIWENGWDVLRMIAQKQFELQQSSDPSQRLIALLASSVRSGRAHCAAMDGGAPPEPARWGWRQLAHGAGKPRWQPLGERIGWVEGEDLYLEPQAALAVAHRLARDEGDELAVTPRTLHRRLEQAGYLKSRDGDRLTVRRTLEGLRQAVLHIPISLLLSETCQTCQEGEDAGISA